MIVFKELSYKVNGILFDVYNQLGGNYHEKYYQRAVAKLFSKRKISFKKEVKVNITIEGDSIGRPL